MNTMKQKSLVFVLAALAGIPLAQAQRSDILPPQRRQPVVEEAEKFLNPPDQVALDAEINNPFFPNYLKPKDDLLTAPVPPSEGPTQAAPASVYDLLETIAPQINPTGSVTLGGQPLLLFGQKRVRVGDELPILFEGERYTLIISRIQSSTFTLRLGAAEVTRPIQSN